MGFLSDRKKAEQFDANEKANGMHEMFNKGMITGEESLAGKLVAMENDRRAEMVAQRQQDEYLNNIQQRMVSN